MNAKPGTSKIVITVILIEVEILVFVIFIADEKKRETNQGKGDKVYIEYLRLVQ